VFGPHDNFDLKNAHVVPALIHRLHIALDKGKLLKEKLSIIVD